MVSLMNYRLWQASAPVNVPHDIYIYIYNIYIYIYIEREKVREERERENNVCTRVANCLCAHERVILNKSRNITRVLDWIGFV